MTKTNRHVPKSSTNKGVLIGLDKSKVKPKPTEVLFCKDDILLRGFNNIPSSLITTPDFAPDLLPEIYKSTISHLRSISFKLGFNSGKMFNEDTCLLQSWLSRQEQLKLIDLRYFKINSLAIIKKLPIEYLLLSSILITDRKQVVQDISDMKHLRYLVQDSLFTTDEINQIKTQMKDINVMSLRDYTKMIIDKKIDTDNL